MPQLKNDLEEVKLINLSKYEVDYSFDVHEPQSPLGKHIYSFWVLQEWSYWFNNTMWSRIWIAECEQPWATKINKILMEQLDNETWKRKWWWEVRSFFPGWRKKLESMKMSFNKTSIKFTRLVNLKMANSTEQRSLQAIVSWRGCLWNINDKKKPTLKNKEKQINQCQSGSISNSHSPNTSWNYYNMQKKSWQLSKELSFLMQICMGISKLYWTLPWGIGMWLGLRQRKMLVKFLRLWLLTIMKGYRMRNTKGFSFWKSLVLII